MKLIKIALLSLLTLTVQAKEVAGIEFGSSVNDQSNNQLNLNGVGIRYKFFFKIYAVGLYVEKTSEDASTILNSNQNNQVVMQIIYDDLSKEKMIDAMNDGFESNLSDAEFSALKSKINSFNDYFDTLKEGDKLIFAYNKDIGTRFILNDVVKGTVSGSDFNQALLKIWLGESPVSDDLKEHMLGTE